MDKEIKTVDEYIAQFPEDIQKKLQEIRAVIKSVLPEKTEEKISWEMPTYKLKHNVAHFAGHKSHIGFYPGASGVENFLPRLKEYKTTKGAIQFPYNKPLPKELIIDIVKFRLKEETDSR